MNADSAGIADGAVASAQRPGWLGRLQLGFEQDDGRTLLRHRVHQGPLRVQKLLYPEHPDTAQVILLHPPGGVVHGDRLEYELQLGAGARVQFTTPGANKFYGGGSRTATSNVHLHIAARAGAEWFPQETILFDGALARTSLAVEIETGGRFGGWEIICFGRAAAGERFDRGHWQQKLSISVDGRPLWFEQASLRGGDPRFDAPAGLDGHAVCGTFVIAGHGDMTLPMEALREQAAEPPAQYGICALPEVFVARYLGDSAEDARRYFSALWTVLRPGLCGRAFVPPRIWRT